MDVVAGPVWDLSAEYASAVAPEIDGDLGALERAFGAIEALNATLVPQLATAAALSPDDATEALGAARAIHALAEQASPLLSNPLTYASCLLSVDARDEAAQALQGRLQRYQVRFAELLEPHAQFLKLVSDAVIAEYLNDPGTAAAAFSVHHGRARRLEMLSLNEENLVSTLAVDGIGAWGRLYTQLSGTLSCNVLVGNEMQTMGIAQASGLMQRSDEPLRRAAWQGINQAWTGAEESCAAAINAIAGWRLSMYSKRSTKQPVHFLDAPTHMNRISRATLDAMFVAVEEAAPLARRAVTAMARAYGKAQFGPWDMRAPAPAFGAVETPTPFAAAIDLIAAAYGEVQPAMADFVRMMADRRWIEGTVTDRKRPGAYCTGFAKSRTSRVYMTYAGSATDVITLAHELGHAFHSWVMRDLPDSQRGYGMSLAETASTFGETAVRDALLRHADSPARRFEIMWEEVAALQSFLLNIPARFTFEQNFYMQREQQPLRPDALKALMSQAWSQWYGDSLSEPDPMYWASKLHFHISGLSFYNFPYTFGYLFSLGIYLRRQEMGADFYSRYVALLRDTGRTTAEVLAQRHLGVDLAEPSFWRDTIARMAPRVAAFEDLVAALA